MPRLSPLAQIVFFATALTIFTGCKTVYGDMYTPKGNRFKPPQEKKEVLPPAARTAPVPNAPQGLPAPGADAGAPAIPGLAPLPDMGGGTMTPPPAPAP